MKWSFAAVGVIILGLIGIAVILLFQSLTTNSENDYYLLKEITEASMLDAIDYKAYRETGKLQIKEKVFVESFTRRFAESTLFVGSTYKIFMYDIMDYPPKATVAIDTGIGKFTIYNETSDYSVYNSLSGILEYNNASFKDISEKSIFSESYFDKTSYPGYIIKKYSKEYYSLPLFNGNGEVNFSQILRAPAVLNVDGGLIKNVSARVSEGPTVISGDSDIFTEELVFALLNREVDWIPEDGTKYLGRDYDGENYYSGGLNDITFKDLTEENTLRLCDDSKKECNGRNTFKLVWDAKANNWVSKSEATSEKPETPTKLFVKYKIEFTYEIYVG